MIEQFLRYSLIGVANTAIHASIMTVCIRHFRSSIAVANSAAFITAVTFSYFANAFWTFSAKASVLKYLMFVAFMGGLAYLTGLAGDKLKINPVIIFVAFTTISLLIGFLYSKILIFGA